MSSGAILNRVTLNEYHFLVKKQAGRCVNSDGAVQIAGRIRLKLRADIAPEDLEQSCYDKCEALTLPEPTGCEFHRNDRTCFAHPVEVERGNGEDGFSCWIFEIAPGDCLGLLVNKNINIFISFELPDNFS